MRQPIDHGQNLDYLLNSLVYSELDRSRQVYVIHLNAT